MNDDPRGDRPPVLDELDHLDVGPAPLGAVIAAGQSAKRRRRAAVASVAAVTALLVAGGLATTHVLGTSAVYDSSVANARTDPPSVAEDGSASAPSRAFDALDMTLVLLEPRRDGLVPSRLTVQNNSDETVTDPGCRLGAGTNPSGLVPADEPAAGLLNPGALMSVYCVGPSDVPPGYDQTFYGPTFRTDGLDAGSYLAVLDYGTLRSERVATPLEIPGSTDSRARSCDANAGQASCSDDSVEQPLPTRSTVPDVLYLSVMEARRVLAEAGLDVVVRPQECPAAAACIFGVLKTTPSPGSVVAQGDVIVIEHFR